MRYRQKKREREREKESPPWLYSQAHSICISDLAAFPKPATSMLSLIKVPRSPPTSARTGYCGLILNKFPHSHKTCPSGLSLSTPHSPFLCLLSLLISLSFFLRLYLKLVTSCFFLLINPEENFKDLMEFSIMLHLNINLVFNIFS